MSPQDKEQYRTRSRGWDSLFRELTCQHYDPDDLEVIGSDYRNGTITRTVACTICGAEWTEVFHRMQPSILSVID